MLAGSGIELELHQSIFDVCDRTYGLVYADRVIHTVSLAVRYQAGCDFQALKIPELSEKIPHIISEGSTIQKTEMSWAPDPWTVKKMFFQSRVVCHTTISEFQETKFR